MSHRAAVACAFLVFTVSAWANTIFSRSVPYGGSYDNSPGVTATYVPGEGVQVRHTAMDDVLSFRFNGAQDWSAYTHLVLVVSNTNGLTGSLVVGIESGPSWSRWHYAYLKLPVGRQVEVALPLTDPRFEQGIEAFPSLNGFSGVQIVGYGRVKLDEVTYVRIGNAERRSAAYTIHEARLINSPIRTTAWIDKYGQQDHISWPTKVVDDSQLLVTENLTGNLPYPADEYGALTTGYRSTSTGRFRLSRDSGQWRFIAPSGYPFFSTGINDVGLGSHTKYEGREHLFVGMPNRTDPYGEHYMDWWDGTRDVLTYNFYFANLHRKHGANWQELAYQHNLRRMRTWGYNTFGGYSSPDYTSRNEMPSTPVLLVSGDYPTLPLMDGNLPDVFDLRYKSAVRDSLVQKLAQLQADPWVIGVFIDNELPWGRGRARERDSRWEVPLAALRSPAGSAAKQAFVTMMTRRYRSISRLNYAWRTNFASWDAMRQNTAFSLGQGTLPPRIERDFAGFLTMYATTYYTEIRRAMRTAGYTGLYLGSRFLSYGYTPEVLNVCRRYCDVVSVNIYDYSPDRLNADLKNKSFPVLISEFGFGSFDQGRLGLAHYQTFDEADTNQAYARYVDSLRTWTNLVGLHWFRFEDFAPSGRMGDGENYAMGLVDITDRPHQSLIDVATPLNQMLVERMQGTP